MHRADCTSRAACPSATRRNGRRKCARRKQWDDDGHGERLPEATCCQCAADRVVGLPAGGRHGPEQSRQAERSQLQEHRQLRALARRVPQGGARQRRLERDHRQRARRHDARSRHHLPRPQAGLLRADLLRLLRQADLAEPHHQRHGQAEAASRPVREGREGPRRAGADHRRLLGARERLRRRHGQPAGAALAGDAGLRLPPARAVPRRADGRTEDHRPRRPDGPRR